LVQEANRRRLTPEENDPPPKSEGRLNPDASISVIMATYNRERSLVESLTSVINQDYAGPMEIIVVDQARRLSQEVADFFNRHEEVARVFQQEPNLPKARNTGSMAANNELLVFVDDDMILPPGALTRFGRRLWPTSRRAVAGLPLSDQMPEGSLEEYARLYGEQIRDVNGGLMEHSHYIPSPFCIPAELYRSLGGFDENLGRLSPTAYGEDNEFWYRAGRSGVKLFIDPGMRVRHRDHLAGGCASRKTDPELARKYHMKSMVYIRIKHHRRMGVEGWLQLGRGFIVNRGILRESPGQIFRNFSTARSAVKDVRTFMGAGGTSDRRGGSFLRSVGLRWAKSAMRGKG
jgi:GT2 family glycosyltransferase